MKDRSEHILPQSASVSLQNSGGPLQSNPRPLPASTLPIHHSQSLHRVAQKSPDTHVYLTIPSGAEVTPHSCLTHYIEWRKSHLTLMFTAIYRVAQKSLHTRCLRQYTEWRSSHSTLDVYVNIPSGAEVTLHVFNSQYRVEQSLDTRCLDVVSRVEFPFVPFLKEMSRCPNNYFRDAQVFRLLNWQISHSHHCNNTICPYRTQMVHGSHVWKRWQCCVILACSSGIKQQIL